MQAIESSEQNGIKGEMLDMTTLLQIIQRNGTLMEHTS